MNHRRLKHIGDCPINDIGEQEIVILYRGLIVIVAMDDIVPCEHQAKSWREIYDW